MAKQEDPKNDSLTVSAEDFKNLAILAGHTGDPLPVVEKLKTLLASDKELARRKLLAYVEVVKYLALNHGTISQQTMMQATMAGRLTEGLGLLALADTLNDPSTEGSSLSRFFHHLFT